MLQPDTPSSLVFYKTTDDFPSFDGCGFLDPPARPSSVAVTGLTLACSFHATLTLSATSGAAPVTPAQLSCPAPWVRVASLPLPSSAHFCPPHGRPRPAGPGRQPQVARSGRTGGPGSSRGAVRPLVPFPTGRSGAMVATPPAPIPAPEPDSRRLTSECTVC